MSLSRLTLAQGTFDFMSRLMCSAKHTYLALCASVFYSVFDSVFDSVFLRLISWDGLTMHRYLTYLVINWLNSFLFISLFFNL